MIPLELKWALLVYSGLIGAGILFIWIYTELTVWRPHRYLGQQFLWRCTFCTFTYLDEHDDQFSECPRCHSINAADDPNARYVPQRHTTTEPVTEASAETRRNPSRRKHPGQRRRGPRRR